MATVVPEYERDESPANLPDKYRRYVLLCNDFVQNSGTTSSKSAKTTATKHGYNLYGSVNGSSWPLRHGAKHWVNKWLAFANVGSNSRNFSAWRVQTHVRLRAAEPAIGRMSDQEAHAALRIDFEFRIGSQKSLNRRQRSRAEGGEDVKRVDNAVLHQQKAARGDGRSPARG